MTVNAGGVRSHARAHPGTCWNLGERGHADWPRLFAGPWLLSYNIRLDLIVFDVCLFQHRGYAYNTYIQTRFVYC
jgi:hypothetical protein